MKKYDYDKLSKTYVNGSNDESDDVNPSTGKLITKIKSMNASDTKKAIELASESFQKWAQVPPPVRGRKLLKAGEIMEQEKDLLAVLMTEEEGKTYNESLSEVIRSYELLKFYGALAFKEGGITLPSNDVDTRIFTLREPIGTVGIISPWNFPLSIPVWKAAPAIAMGNSIVLKPASKTPLIAAAFLDILRRADIPENVVSLVVGQGKSVGDVIVKDEMVSAISFTGSMPTGKGIYKALANKEKSTRIQLELGGKNALYVDDSADLSLAVKLAVKGAFGLTGQSCTATSRLIVHKDIYEEIKKAVISEVRNLKVGDGLSGADMGPVVDKNQLNTDLEYIDSAINDGADLLYGGALISDNPSGLFLSPTVFDSVTPDMRLFKEEVFGPVLAMTSAENDNDAVGLVNSVTYGHTAGIVAKDITKINKFITHVEAGVIKVNKPTVGLELQAPFGTFKDSGANTWKEMGEEGMSFYSREKTVYVGW